MQSFYPSASFFRLSASFHRSSILFFNCLLVLAGKNRPSLSAFEKQCFFRNHRALNSTNLLTFFPLPYSLFKDLSPHSLRRTEGRSALLGYCQGLKSLYQFPYNEPLTLPLFPHFVILPVFSAQPENSDFHRYLF